VPQVPGIKFRVEMTCLGKGGTEDRCEVVEVKGSELAMEMLGARRKCPDCGQRYHSKGALQNLPGTCTGTGSIAC
jgi:hypothetical protein